MSTLKERKEAFVSDLTGGSIGEINSVTSVALVGYFAWCLVNRSTSLFHGENRWSYPSLTLDFLMNWIGLLLSITLYSSSPMTLAAAIASPAILVIVSNGAPTSTKSTSTTKKSTNDPVKELLPKKTFLTVYRGSMLIITTLAILAVDFPIFPRRFAKVETWGTSLMDLGVGSFVFSMGVVSARSLIVEEVQGIQGSYLSKLFKSIRSTITPLTLGLLRLVLVKNLEYQEHVTEYGVHWNFYITLVLVGPLSILLGPLCSWVPRSLVALMISLTYEYFITQREGFLSYLLLAQRTDLISSNREGIFSLIGYLSIFLVGQSTGFYVLPSKITKNNLFKPSTVVQKSKQSTFTKLTSVSPITGLIFWSAVYLTLSKFIQDNHYYNVSRRLANLPYVIWVCAYNTCSLLLFALVDKFLSPLQLDYESRIPVSFDAINSNGMILFLLANVSTGLVNMTFDTLDATTGASIAILICYSAWIAVAGAVLYKNKIFVKL